MNLEENIFLELTQYETKREINSSFEEVDWNRVFNLCANNKMIANTYDAVKKVNGVPKDLLDKWEKYRLMTFIRQKKCQNSIQKILQIFNENKISYALFKGGIIADLYQNPFYRFSSDTDIYVDENDREKATEVIIQQGYEYIEEESKSTFVGVFYNKESGSKIELHTSLFEDYSGKQIDILNSMKLTDSEKRILLEIDGFEIVTLGHEEHLIFQMFHFIKHFIVQGVSIRYLIDITLFANKYYDEINWNIFWDKMKLLKYEAFCEKLFLLCIKYYGLKEEILSNRNVKMTNDDEELLLLDFIYVGNVDDTRNADWQIMRNLKGYLVGEKKEISESKSKKMIRYLFPNTDDLQDYYYYAKKNKLLLPIAWIHRIFHVMIYHYKNPESYNAQEKIQALSQRENLIVKLGLVENDNK